MASVNKVILVGRVGQDVKSNRTGSGKTVCNISLATSFKVSGKEETLWHRVQAWEKQAEFAESYIKKGDMIYVEGRLAAAAPWTKKDGTTVEGYEIVANNISILTSFSKSEKGGEQPAQRREQKAAKPVDENDIDDIPF